jgi:hypothetical protein
MGDEEVKKAAESLEGGSKKEEFRAVGTSLAAFVKQVIQVSKREYQSVPAIAERIYTSFYVSSLKKPAPPILYEGLETHILRTVAFSDTFILPILENTTGNTIYFSKESVEAHNKFLFSFDLNDSAPENEYLDISDPFFEDDKSNDKEDTDSESSDSPANEETFGLYKVNPDLILTIFGDQPPIYYQFLQQDHSLGNILAFFLHETVFQQVPERDKIQFSRWITNVLQSPLSEELKYWFVTVAQLLICVTPPFHRIAGTVTTNY